MKIEIKKLSLTNFKGIRSLSVEFGTITNIWGQNTSGKTTLMDAFLWLLFGKDSTDRKDFEIKTLGPNNEVYHNLDHEVEAILLVDGVEITIRRCFKEKWTKKKGNVTSEFVGHETGYFWNDVPMKQEEFNGKISNLLDERLFKLISNVNYFNNLKWQDRRNVLMQLAGTISNDDVLDEIVNNRGAMPGIDQLMNALKQDKTVVEFRKEIAAKKKKLQDELELIPSRISEAQRAMPDEINYEEVEASVNKVLIDIDNIDGLLMNKSKAAKEHQEAITVKINEAGKHSSRCKQIEFDEANKVKQLSFERQKNIMTKKEALRNKTDEKLKLLNEYNKDKETLIKLEQQKENVSKEYQTESNSEIKFNDNDFHCPACKRAFDETVIDSKKDQLTANFNKSKSEKLKQLMDQGNSIADQIVTLTAKIDNTKVKGSAVKAEIETLQNDIQILEEEHSRLQLDEDTQVKTAVAGNAEYKSLQELMETLNDEINTPYKAEDNSALLNRKRELNQQVDELKKQLGTKVQREKQSLRIQELQDEESKMAQELATLEGVEFSIEQFIKIQMETLENRINGRFKIVRFKMFEDQINGGRTEDCTTLINGVPYSDANTAAKIQAGLDIINTLSEHYDVLAPVWVDNRESVTWLPETSNQLINLIVSPNDKKLRIEKAQMAAVA